MTEHDTVITTGWWKKMTFEILLILVAPYPFLQDVTYTEFVDQYHVDIRYEVNDILLCFSFLRSYQFLRCTLVVS